MSVCLDVFEYTKELKSISQANKTDATATNQTQSRSIIIQIQ